MILIRNALPGDAPALLEIYAPYVRETAVSFEYTVPEEAVFRERIRKTLERYPYLVAEIDSRPVGYCYAGPFHVRKACEHSAEVSIYVSTACRRQGVGKQLYAALEERLAGQGIRNLYASIAWTREPDPWLTEDSLRFHRAEGYMECGHFHRCGYKFGRWYDLIYMEKFLAPKTP